MQCTHMKMNVPRERLSTLHPLPYSQQVIKLAAIYFLYQTGNLGCHSGMRLGYNSTLQPQANLHMIVFIGTETALKRPD